ncbi:TetR/AcrR family transcriptional regulator [Kiloniella majae]|uniref:TetR/AcrR family transcriptional regulator n=1 Tax=Kiloniella majae TaxID=1938558 RepID=UPI000A277C8F|nr:TetR/AcrR family transcriptional regulator [Kiloniella majae]
MIDTKKVGRPKKFKRELALKAALHVFWVKGYEGASMKDLTLAMGINGPSLYAEFGDKLSLYKETIDSYTTNDGCAPMVAFESEPDIEQAVREFMNAVIDYATLQESGARGCYLSSCVATNAIEIDGIDKRLKNAISDTDNRIESRFDVERAKGVLPNNFPSLQRARLMFDLRQGHVFRARSGCSAASMKEDLDFHVDLILK